MMTPIGDIEIGQWKKLAQEIMKLENEKELYSNLLNEADVAYYRDDRPAITDREYDAMMGELQKLEAETGVVLSGSPTQKVSGEILKELTPVRNTKPMLSADKTKSIDDLVRFAGDQSVLLSWKMDGLTLVLRYEKRKVFCFHGNFHQGGIGCPGNFQR